MAFKLKSGNKPQFKVMGSSPMHQDEGTIKNLANITKKGLKGVGKVANYAFDKVFSLPGVIGIDAVDMLIDPPKTEEVGIFDPAYGKGGKDASPKEILHKSVWDNTIGWPIGLLDLLGESTGLFDIDDAWSDLKIQPKARITEKTTFKKPDIDKGEHVVGFQYYTPPGYNPFRQKIEIDKSLIGAENVIHTSKPTIKDWKKGGKIEEVTTHNMIWPTMSDDPETGFDESKLRSTYAGHTGGGSTRTQSYYDKKGRLRKTVTFTGGKSGKSRPTIKKYKKSGKRKKKVKYGKEYEQVLTENQKSAHLDALYKESADYYFNTPPEQRKLLSHAYKNIRKDPRYKKSKK